MNIILQLLAIFGVISICSVNCVKYQASELKGVVALFRHGDRAPIEPYKNDPYNVSYWPMGWGQLTNVGKLQQYYLGQWFRRRYENFLPDIYSLDFFRAQSSHSDRCLMSASSHLAGLYPPVGRQVWNPSLNWQPIPIHTTLIGNDPMLALDKPCPKFEQLYNDLMQNEFHDFFEANKELFESLSQNSGNNITNLQDLTLLFNTLYIEKLYNLTLPQWAEDIYPVLEPIVNFTFATYTYTPELARLRTGPLINQITSFFESIISSSSALKYLVLSAHDTNIATLLDSLGLFDFLWPEYASSVILELHQENKNHFVNIFYKNSTYIKNLTLDGCNFDCEFESFQQIVEPLRLDLKNWDKECASSTKQ